MIDFADYMTALSSSGPSRGSVLKNQSDIIMNASFTNDPTYRKVYILDRTGWKFEDAKYQFHMAQSISKDAVDYYLQFRPKVHYPIGSYVIVPDDTSPDVDLTEEELKNPFLQPVEKRFQWWIIVGRDNANAFVRYNILKCNWNFQWLYKGQVQNCFGCVRNANSYTSGKWTDEYSSSLDDLNGAWIPDTAFAYGEGNLEHLGLSDTRTIMHEQRFMLTHNKLDPKVYQATKITDLFPAGIIKMSLKQDDVNPVRDNLDLLICDYYDENGETAHDHVLPEDPAVVTIAQYIVDPTSGELVKTDSVDTQLHIGKTSYYHADFQEPFSAEWNIEFINDGESSTSTEDAQYYCGLIKLSRYSDSIVSVKPGKAKSLIGKKFRLVMADTGHSCAGSLDLEVIA